MCVKKARGDLICKTISDELRIPKSDAMNDADKASIDLANCEIDVFQFMERVTNYYKEADEKCQNHI